MLKFSKMGVCSAFIVYLLTGTNVHAQPRGTWVATGSLTTGRDFHTSTMLANGKVLVVGGYSGRDPCCSVAELYDPATGQWSATGSMIKPRGWHIAVRLASGKVLVAGGFSGAIYNSPEISSEIYDPDTAAWSAAGNLNIARAGHMATLTINSTRYCTGDPWNLKVTSSPDTLIQLSGTSNGKPWEVPDWRKTDTNGNLSETGTFAPDTEGDHSVRVDIGGRISDAVSFNVSRCEIKLSLNSSDYCTGAPWTLRVDSDFPNGWMSLSGTTNNEPWEIANWLTTGVDGKRTAEGVFISSNEGVHTIRVRIGEAQSNLLSFKVSRCGP